MTTIFPNRGVQPPISKELSNISSGGVRSLAVADLERNVNLLARSAKDGWSPKEIMALRLAAEKALVLLPMGNAHAKSVQGYLGNQQDRRDGSKPGAQFYNEFLAQLRNAVQLLAK